MVWWDGGLMVERVGWWEGGSGGGCGVGVGVEMVAAAQHVVVYYIKGTMVDAPHRALFDGGRARHVAVGKGGEAYGM